MFFVYLIEWKVISVKRTKERKDETTIPSLIFS